MMPEQVLARAGLTGLRPALASTSAGLTRGCL
jgi:hypothetical protein